MDVPLKPIGLLQSEIPRVMDMKTFLKNAYNRNKISKKHHKSMTSYSINTLNINLC